MTTIRIATRKSPLALWQADFVKAKLTSHYPELKVELLSMLTIADKISLPLNKIGGKGLFVKELEKALFEQRADIAVHSIKDLPGELPHGLELAIICQRDDPRDALVSNRYHSLLDLPQGAIVGTSSLRRKVQILALRPDLTIQPLRGNVGSRLQKLDQGEFDAIILAAAGLTRLQLTSRISYYFPVTEMLPAAGQGAIGIECRISDHSLRASLHFLSDLDTAWAVTAERELNKELGGSCQIPLAAYATIKNQTLVLNALLSDPEGRRFIRAEQRGPMAQAKQIGIAAAAELFRQGARELLP